MIDRPDSRFASYFKKLAVLAMLLAAASPSLSQWSLQTLSSARYGELPNSFDGSNPSFYSDLLFEYRYNRFRAGLRVEGFDSPNLSAEYNHISQRYLEVNTAWASARVGNVFGIFGRGIILRAFELPGFLYESINYKVQQRVIRDFDGVKVDLSPGPLRVTFLHGTPIDPLLPPDFDERRTGDLTGGQFSLSLPAAVSIGTAYLEHETTFKSRLSTYFLNWNADPLIEKMQLPDLTLDFYAEYANDAGYGEFTGLDRQSPHALYLAGSLTYGRFGGSLEYKDYQKFDFGINDPPPLVRENTESLLNRSTHVLDANSEKGFQLELFYTPFALTRVVLNHSRARNYFTAESQPRYVETYLAIERFGDPWSVRFFVDSGKDELVSETERFTTGIAPDYILASGSTIGLDLQVQRIRRSAPPFFDYRLTNLHSSLRLQNWHKFTLALNGERSTDPDVTETSKYFLNFTLGWQPLSPMNFQLFAGSRRGGTACDHGYCIEVLDFEGIELRMETRW